MKEIIILVDENDKEIGNEEKMKAHLEGKLHRAFSILIFNLEGKMLIHKRAESKYHSGGLWTNACCSHPRVNEELSAAVHRRLMEEMGFDCELNEIFNFIYKKDVGDELIEHEFDHVFVGEYDGKVNPNPQEVDDYKWISLTDLDKEIKENPENFTEWFKILFNKFIDSTQE